LQSKEIIDMPDFGIMRGFNEKLFGDKLVAGQLPTQLGLIGSQEVFNFDIDAIAFFDRVTAAGGLLSVTEKNAVNTLVLQMKADGIWTKMKAIYPMVGASAAACAQNLKSSSFTGSFTSGWTFASTGLTPNGTSAYFDSTLNANSNLAVTNAHFSLYINTFINRGIDSANGLFPSIFLDQYNASQIYYGIGVDNVVSVANQIGFLQVNALSTMNLYKNGISLHSKATGGTLNSRTLLIGAANFSIPIYFWSGTMSFSSIGDGLTDTQASNFYTAVQAFQTTLGRQV
jgi:hypothetical protein